jgi:hypothetical protein
MPWRSLIPATGAGLLGSAAFWWVAATYLCGECPDGGSCTWDGSCLVSLGIPLAVVLVAVAVVVPFRLVLGRWPGRAPD